MKMAWRQVWVPAAALVLALFPLAFVHPLWVRGQSMDPTLRDGERCWVLRAWVAGAPRRGEIWLLQTPDGAALKRVVGLPGERIAQRGGDLFLAGHALPEPFVQHPERGDGGPWEAGAGYLVMGDNRPRSRDSRAYGPVALREFQGRVLGF
jgi:signal peptidase I